MRSKVQPTQIQDIFSINSYHELTKYLDIKFLSEYEARLREFNVQLTLNLRGKIVSEARKLVQNDK